MNYNSYKIEHFADENVTREEVEPVVPDIDAITASEEVANLQKQLEFAKKTEAVAIKKEKETKSWIDKVKEFWYLWITLIVLILVIIGLLWYVFKLQSDITLLKITKAANSFSNIR